MPNLQHNVDQKVVDEVIKYANEKNGDHGYSLTYSEIAQMVGHELTKDDVSAICLKHGLRRKHRGSTRQTEDSILAEIKKLHDQLSVMRQRVIVIWTLTGKKFSVENCTGKKDEEIVSAVRSFLHAQRANRDNLH